MTPKQQWHLLTLSNAPIENIEQGKHKANLMLEIIADIEKPNEIPIPDPAPDQLRD